VNRRTFPGSPASVSEARRYVVDVIGDVPAAVEEAVSIVVSELATNCVRHAGTDFTIDVERTPTELRVEVADQGSGVPIVRSPAVSEPSGRGLNLVRELSDAWGIGAKEGAPGKGVWFTMNLSEPTGAGGGWRGGR
jgi:anti-sigma regulatory factor (Ser/Thr protein kinase)